MIVLLGVGTLPYHLPCHHLIRSLDWRQSHVTNLMTSMRDRSWYNTFGEHEEMV